MKVKSRTERQMNNACAALSDLALAEAALKILCGESKIQSHLVFDEIKVRLAENEETERQIRVRKEFEKIVESEGIEYVWEELMANGFKIDKEEKAT